MVGFVRKYHLILILLFAVEAVFAQGHLFTRVKTNKTSVYVGQPVEVTVSVHTSTWFTKGVNPGNIKVNDAFTVYFRSVNSSERINGKTYAGVNMIFHVFPYNNEDIIFPALSINVETPDEGTSKGIARVIKTKPLNISVKPVPVNYNSDNWMVSPGVSVTENWSGNLNQIKVGDVIERSIFIEAQWLVAELIPPIIWDTIQGVSIYPSRAQVNNNKTKTSISASRTDGVKYLFEKEGEVEIPELAISWWNPQAGKLQKRTLKKVVVNVLPNPDLGMLESIRDSLMTDAIISEQNSGQKQTFSIFGYSLKQIVVFLLMAGLIIYFLYKLYFPIKKALFQKRQNYLNSELYYFRKFQKAQQKKDVKLATKELYRWLDQIALKEPTIDYFIKNYGVKKLRDQYQLEELNNSVVVKNELLLNHKLWVESRSNYIRNSEFVNKSVELYWINP